MSQMENGNIHAGLWKMRCIKSWRRCRKQERVRLRKKRRFTSYAHVGRNIPRTNTAHICASEWVSACNDATSRRMYVQNGTVPNITLSSLYCRYFYCRRVQNFRFRSFAPRALLAPSRKALAFGFPVFKPRSYPDYERVLHEECSPPGKLHSRVPWEACIHEDELRYILETYGDTRRGYRSLYPESARRGGGNKEIIYQVAARRVAYRTDKEGFADCPNVVGYI